MSWAFARPRTVRDGGKEYGECAQRGREYRARGRCVGLVMGLVEVVALDG